MSTPQRVVAGAAACWKGAIRSTRVVLGTYLNGLQALLQARSGARR